MSAPLTILVVTWNGWADTRKLLNSLRAAELPEGTELLVVDNASTDGTPEAVAAAWPSARVVRNPENVGHARGVNQGLRMAYGRRVLVLDSDTEVAPDAIVRLLGQLDADPGLAIVAPRTFNTDGSVQQTARAFPSALSGLFGRRSLLTRLFPGNPISRRYLMSDRLDASAPYEVEQVSAAAMLFAAALVAEVGPWDEAYRGYWVDTDWCFRVRRAGHRIACVPGATVIHHEQNKPGRKLRPARIWSFHLGAWRFYHRNVAWGWLDPRALVAMTALVARATLLIVMHAFKADEPPVVARTPGAGDGTSASPDLGQQRRSM